VLFAPGEERLIGGASAQMQRIADLLNTTAHARRRVSVEGHADATGTAEGNASLSEGRASVVAESLVRAGVDAARISTRGLGSTRPVATNATPEGRARNRRVEIVLLHPEG
jgi:outer membrane protein OmpA-like peptidoglycan-associated protein